MTKVLVTGAAGYIGTYFCKFLLERGYHVRAVDNGFKGNFDTLLPFVDDPKFEFMYGDVTSFKDCEKMVDGVDYISHLASIVGYPSCKRWPNLAKDVNVEGCKNIIEARNKHNESIPLVYNSTGSVYGKIEEICTESTKPNPLTVYGETKLLGENYISKYGHTVSMRLATAFGVSPCMRVNLLVNDFVSQALENRFLVLYEEQARRTFIHIKDICRSILHFFDLMNIGKADKIYNVGTSNLNMTKLDVADIVSRKTGCDIFLGSSGKDLDQRDYEVDYSKLTKTGFRCEYDGIQGMEEEVENLIKASKMLCFEKKYQ